MQIKILNYTASTRGDVHAFVDLELNGWLRFNGIHYQRDGTLRSAQLTPVRHGRRIFVPAVEVSDADLRELLAVDILAAIHAHIETLPPEKRVKEPRPAPPRPAPQRNQPVIVKPAQTGEPKIRQAPMTVNSVAAAPAKRIPQTVPPLRLLANFPRVAAAKGNGLTREERRSNACDTQGGAR
jgi:hypothetical protein